MSVSGAMPIATAVAAVVLLIVLELQQLGRPGRSVWPYLLPVGSVPLVGAVVAFKHLSSGQSSALAVVAASAMCSVVVTSSAALIFATHAAGYVSGRSSGVAHRALIGGFVVLVLFALLFRAEDGMLIAAVPAGVGVICTWIGARSFSDDKSKQSKSSRAAILTLLALSLALGAIAAACIAAACAVLSVPSRSAAEAMRTLARMTTFASAPLIAGAIAFGKRAEILGIGARGRVKEVVVTVCVLVLSAAGLRAAFAGVVKARAKWPTAVHVVRAPARVGISTPSSPPSSEQPTAALPAASAKASEDTGAGEPIEFGEVTVNGPLYPGEVQKRVEKARPYIEKCRERAAEAGRAGRLLVKLSIGTDGSVKNVLEDENTDITNKKFVHCVLASFYQIGFPAPSKGNVRVEAPIQIR